MSSIGSVAYAPHRTAHLPPHLAQVKVRVDSALTPGVKRWVAEEAQRMIRTRLLWPLELIRLQQAIRVKFSPLARAIGQNPSTIEPTLMFAVICAVWDLLNSVGDDAQLADVDLQNKVQQTISKIQKDLNDAALAIINNLKG
jgi:hypothetical protein